EAGAAPLLDALGLGTPADIEITSHLLAATAPSGDRSIALLVVRWGEPLQLHWRSGIEHATRRAARWCLLFNGTALRLIDAARPHSARYPEFDPAIAPAD